MTGRIEFEVKVCSMRSRSWKKNDEQWPDMEITWQNLVALNGDVYWLAADRKCFLLSFSPLRNSGSTGRRFHQITIYLRFWMFWEDSSIVLFMITRVAKFI